MNAFEKAPQEEIRPDWVPAELQRGAKVAALEKDRLWPRIWQMACREAELTKVGDFVNYEINDDSILIVRTGKGEGDFMAYYNVCQHRGRKLRYEYSGNLGGGLSCGFHGWQYSITGENTLVPFLEQWEGCPQFNSESRNLTQVRLERWGGWIWINQDDDAEPLLDYLGVIPELLDPFEPENMRPVWWKTIYAPVNWKVILGAFNESYHAIPTHNSRFIYTMNSPSKAVGLHSNFWFGPPLGATRYKNEKGKWVTAKSLPEMIWAAHKVLDDMLFAMTLEPTMDAAKRLKDEVPADAPFEEVLGKFWQFQMDEMARRGVKWPERLTPEAVEAAGVDWHVFPNTLVLPTVDGALWYRLRPHKSDPDQCIFEVWSFGRFAPGKEPKIENEFFDGFGPFKGHNPFLEEDFPNILAVQDGMKIRGWKGSRTNPEQEVAVTNFFKNLWEYLDEPA